MNILAIETSSKLSSIVLKAEETNFGSELPVERHQAQNMLPSIQALMDEAGITLQDLDWLALGAGPGSFTGLRIAASVIQAIAFVYNLPVVPVSSLQVFAQAAYEKIKEKQVLVAVNAYQKEVYFGGYQLDEENLMQPVIPDSLVKPDEAPFPKSGNWVGVGDAWEMYREELKPSDQSILKSCVSSDIFPTASALLKLAEKAFSKGGSVRAEEALPVYLREQDAWKRS